MKIPSPRTLLAVPSIVIVTALCGSLAIAFSFLDKSGRTIDWVSGLWARGLAFVTGMRVRSQGAGGIDPSKSYIVVSNHQSHMDTVALFRASPVPLRMLVKGSLFKIPIFGRAMARAGHIRISRAKDKKIDFDRLLHQVEKLERAGRSITVFAEGTRSLDGRLGRFKHGAFTIARHFHLPILPVTIIGTRDILPAKSLDFFSGEARVIFHEPFEVGQESVEALLEKTRSIIEKALEQG